MFVHHVIALLYIEAALSSVLDEDLHLFGATQRATKWELCWCYRVS